METLPPVTSRRFNCTRNVAGTDALAIVPVKHVATLAASDVSRMPTDGLTTKLLIGCSLWPVTGVPVDASMKL